MLIIFDLDDTLIDTSGVITPFKIKQCLHKIGIPPTDTALAELTAINQKVPTTKEALTQFILKRGGDEHLIKLAFKELVSPLPDDFVVPTTPHAKEILQFFAANHTLALVTGGFPPFQLEKLKKAGIEASIFSKIAIPENSIKKPIFEGLLREFSTPAKNSLVCGDRIAMDLVPARDLGITTVHMRWGRGRQMETESWVNHAITNLLELKGIIQ